MVIGEEMGFVKHGWTARISDKEEISSQCVKKEACSEHAATIYIHQREV